MPEIIIKSAIAERFERFMAGGRALFFSAPCGFSKTALAEALLRGQNVLHLSAGDEGFALPPADGRWRVLLLDDLQNMQDENDWNALCELIHSGADRRFVLLSPWRASGLSDRLPVQRNGNNTTVRCPKQYDKAAGSIMNCTPFVRQYDILFNKWGVLLCQKEYQTNDIRRNSKNWLWKPCRKRN